MAKVNPRPVTFVATRRPNTSLADLEPRSEDTQLATNESWGATRRGVVGEHRGAACVSQRRCGCVGGYRTFTAKQLMSNAALVFVADVADVGRSTVGQHVTFDVLEAYQGVQVGKHTVEFENEFDAFQFEAHQRVLVVAYPTSEPRVRALDGSERYASRVHRRALLR